MLRVLTGMVIILNIQKITMFFLHKTTPICINCHDQLIVSHGYFNFNINSLPPPAACITGPSTFMMMH